MKKSIAPVMIILLFLCVFAAAILAAGYFLPGSAETNEIISIDSGSFCGSSQLGQCNSDSECVTGGCSGQLCQSASAEPGITTCEFRSCYNAASFNLSCKCFENKCQWIQRIK